MAIWQGIREIVHTLTNPYPSGYIPVVGASSPCRGYFFFFLHDAKQRLRLLWAEVLRFALIVLLVLSIGLICILGLITRLIFLLILIILILVVFLILILSLVLILILILLVILLLFVLLVFFYQGTGQVGLGVQISRVVAQGLLVGIYSLFRNPWFGRMSCRDCK